MNLLNDQNTDISTSINNINKNIGIFHKSNRNYLKQKQTMVRINKLPPNYPYDLRNPYNTQK